MRRPALLGLAAAALAALGVTTVVLETRLGPQPPPAAAPAGPLPAPVGDITCDRTDHKEAPMTVRLTIQVNGRARDIPATVGISNALVDLGAATAAVTRADCYYWVHTGRDDGVVHIDPPGPDHRPFTLGDVADVWHLPLGTDRVGHDQGPVHSWVDGHAYPGNPRTIALTDGTTVRLDVETDGTTS